MTQIDDAPVTLIGPDDGDLLGDPESVLDRFMIEGEHSGQRFAIVEHRLAPRALAAPLHLHTREDEYSFILEGEVGAYLGGKEVIAKEGDLLFKPRDQWHTFWNAGTTQARLLEVISPAGLEKMFRLLDTSPELYEPEKLSALGSEYGAKIDLEGTGPIAERHGLSF